MDDLSYEAGLAYTRHLEKLIAWLDSNTTFYDVQDGGGPVLAKVSKRIWYHATDDQASYPFSAVMRAALGIKSFLPSEIAHTVRVMRACGRHENLPITITTFATAAVFYCPHCEQEATK